MSAIRMEVLQASIRILNSATRQLLSSRLDSKKILLTSLGLHRDWRGLAEQAHLEVSIISNSRISPTEHCFQLWVKNPGTVGQMLNFLEAMDRFDVIDDSLTMIYDDYDKSENQVGGLMTVVPPPMDQQCSSDPDILTIDDIRNLNEGGEVQHFDALVLSADEDCDFVQELVEKLEGEYGLKLCLKDRNLVGGLQFETETIVKLILERCSRVIVVLSPEFLQSYVNQYFTSFAHALSVDQRRRIVIPCQIKPCQKPAIISFCHSLDYYRAKGYWNYWEKLRDSVSLQPSRTHSRPSIEPAERIQEIHTTSTVALSPETPSLPSPSSPRNFFSKFLRKGDSTSKLKLSSSESSTHTANKRSSSGSEFHLINGHASSAAIPISRSTPKILSSSVSSAESNDLMNVLGDLPNVPETPPTSPLSTTSSAALLIAEETSPSPKSPSRLLNRFFKGKQKRKDYG